MRKIIVLKNSVNPDGSQIANYVFWLTPPVAIQKSNPSFTSLVPDVTTPELTALQNGTVIEQSYSTSFKDTNSMAAKLISDYNTQQTFLNAQLTVKNYSGTYWDGTTWFNVPA